MSFDYLIEKIGTARFSESPFRHIFIERFLRDEHFKALTKSPEIDIPPVSSDEEIFEELDARGYQVVDFPGCITDKKIYMRWRQDPASVPNFNDDACEGFGVTLRLTRPESSIVRELQEFLADQRFLSVLAEKFGIAHGETTYDGGLQKYLDGYEISPHPDIRRKALTYMLNANPGDSCGNCSHHTHYMRFLPQYRYVQAYWDGNPERDRCWVPWAWCETVSLQEQNNSFVAFSPANDTLHAVRARYDHLSHQRTQFYGNLWFTESPCSQGPRWQEFAFSSATKSEKSDFGSLLKSLFPASVVRVLRRSGRAEYVDRKVGGK